MTPGAGAGLFVAAIAGGVINSVAGGGTFVTFPSLLLAGVPAVQANATSTIALWPGVISSTLTMRRELRDVPALWLMAVASVTGGLAGALLLLKLPSSFFELVVPFLLLGATALFGFSPVIVRRLRLTAVAGGPSRRYLGMVAGVQVLIGVYGGYFGGGVGIMMLAALALLGMPDLRRVNAFRLFLSFCINGVAVVAFSIGGAVLWPEAILMLLGSILGGYLGARAVRRLEPQILRFAVIGFGLAMSLYLFLRQYGP